MNSKRKNRGKYSPPLCTLRRRRIPCWNISGVSSAFQSEGCISVPPLEKASFPFPLVAQEKRSIPLSIAREKMRFPFEFLHLNEARGIRTKTRIYIYIYTQNPVSNSFARTTVALRPAPVILHPSASIVFFHFSTQETASLVDLFISSCFALRRPALLLLPVHRRLVVPILRPFRSISVSSFRSRRLRRWLDDVDVFVSTLTSPRSRRFPAIGSAGTGASTSAVFKAFTFFLFHGNNFFFSRLRYCFPLLFSLCVFPSLFFRRGGDGLKQLVVTALRDR